MFFLGFICLQDLLGSINWVNIFAPLHCTYVSVIGGTRWNRYFDAPTLQVCMYDERNNIRFIPKGIGIYWKVLIIHIKKSLCNYWHLNEALLYNMHIWWMLIISVPSLINCKEALNISLRLLVGMNETDLKLFYEFTVIEKLNTACPIIWCSVLFFHIAYVRMWLDVEVSA